MSDCQRNCPKCGRILYYSNKYHAKYAERDNRQCKECYYEYLRAGNAPFQGRHHSQTTKDKLSKHFTGKKLTDETVREKIRESSRKNSWMSRGISLFEYLVEKHGLEEATKRFEVTREKHRKNATGSNNPMYGKPTPKKAGNGWSGWYKNKFFRSLRELSYIVLELENKKRNWESAENIRIKYTNYDGNERTYSPDFLVDKKLLIEIKPTKLINTPTCILKANAAKLYCLEHNLEYVITDSEIIDINILKDLIDTGLVILTEKTQKKLQKWLLENYT